MIIYKATNRLNGKVYIGQTINNLKDRKADHINKANNHPDRNNHFCNALRKYGVDSFNWEVICICPNIDSLNEREQYYISYYNAIKDGYNLTTGGLNYIVSDESRKKMSKASLGRKVSTKTREKMREASLGRTFSKETREKLRQSNLGKIRTPETRKNISLANLGRKHTPESIEKMSGKNNHNYGKKHSEKTRERISKAKLGHSVSRETREKLSKANSGKNNPNHGKHPSEQTKKKIKESNIRTWYRKRGVYIKYSQFCLFKTL